ncbi:MAG: M48 family metalloprotease [Abditibacteriota bacterium]|nr:M48 family metalloprotease [Abditibacteriota bacterium]
MKINLRAPFLICLLTAFVCGAAFGYSLEKELKTGAKVAKEVEKEMPPSDNEAAQKAIEELGAKFMPHIERKDVPYHFKVVEAKGVMNAFALPGGYVYFTERMWQILTPEERAAVMAHEITHSDKRHAITAQRKANQRALWSLPLVVLGPVGMNVMAVGNVMISMRYSRKQEQEADEAGMDLLVKAGFDPAGSVTSMKKLRAIENEYNKYEISSVFSDHPETQKRIDYLTARAVKYGSKPEDLEVKPFDDPAAIGKVAKILADLGGVEASLTIKAAYGDKFVVKKMLYDDASKTAKPVKVADAVSMASGRYVTLLLTPVDVYEKADIAVGDGIYLEPETEEAETPADSGEEKGKKE